MATDVLQAAVNHLPINHASSKEPIIHLVHPHLCVIILKVFKDPFSGT